jgi:uncharacterized membrane protein YgcG
MKSIITVVMLVVCLNLSAQKGKNIGFIWHDVSTLPVFPDSADYVSVKKGAILYCFSNDDSLIFANLKFTESIEQNKILQTGLTLWVNSDGKSRKETGIRFPIGAKYSKVKDLQINNAYEIPTPLSLANTIQLVGFKGVTHPRFPSGNKDNIRGSVKYDKDGNLLYELVIPFSKLPEMENKSDGKIVAMTFAIEFGVPPSVGGPKGGNSGYTPPSGGGSRGGGGGRSGGARGSLGNGPSGAGSQTSPDAVIVWVKDLKLAQKK